MTQRKQEKRERDSKWIELWRERWGAVGELIGDGERASRVTTSFQNDCCPKPSPKRTNTFSQKTAQVTLPHCCKYVLSSVHALITGFAPWHKLDLSIGAQRNGVERLAGWEDGGECRQRARRMRTNWPPSPPLPNSTSSIPAASRAGKTHGSKYSGQPGPCRTGVKG